MNEFKRILHAFNNSFNGFISAFRDEAAFRWEVLVCVIGTVIAIYLPLDWVTRFLLISSLLLILLMELVNTAIEATIDRISADRHPLSKKAKDIGSLIVLISFANAGIIWAIVLIKYLF